MTETHIRGHLGKPEGLKDPRSQGPGSGKRREEVYLERIPEAICFSLGNPRNNTLEKPVYVEQQLCPGKNSGPFLEKIIEFHHLAPPVLKVSILS